MKLRIFRISTICIILLSINPALTVSALVNKPKILFADEPCANLDSKSSSQILELFKRLNKELEQTIVMVTHEDWHTEYTNRSIYLKDGLIKYE